MVMARLVKPNPEMLVPLPWHPFILRPALLRTCSLGEMAAEINKNCEKVAESGGTGAPFSRPFPPEPNRASTAAVAHVFDLHSPPSPGGPILAPRALSLKRTSLHIPCASWLAV